MIIALHLPAIHHITLQAYHKPDGKLWRPDGELFAEEWPAEINVYGRTFRLEQTDYMYTDDEGHLFRAEYW